MFSQKRIIRLFFYLILIGVILLILSSIYFVVKRNNTVVLPKPTGQFAVGRVGLDLVDDSRNEAYSETEGNKRKLSVWIWYPSDTNQNAKKAEYFPEKWETEQEKSQGMPYLQQNYKTIQTNSFQKVPVSNRQATYPLIVFEPGMGKIVFNYQALAENLASQGYIVASVNPTYSSDFVVFSDGSTVYKTTEGSMPEGKEADEQLNAVGSKLIKTWTQIISFTINKLGEMNAEQGSMWNGHIDMGHIGAFGHSFGGAASAEVCLLDDRVKAGIDIDGYLYGVEKNPEKPFMFIMSKHQQNGIDLQEVGKIQGFYNSFKQDGYLLEIPEAAHFSFSDNTLFFSPILKVLGVYGTINGERGLQITNSYITAFFDKYLKNINSNLLKQKSSQYPEVKIQLK